MTTSARPGVRPPHLLALVAAGASLTGCGNAVTAEVVGTAAITVAADGTPIALVRVCRGEVDTVRISGDRAGLADDEPNPTLGIWRARGGQDGLVELALHAANDGWSGPDDLPLAAGRPYILTAADADEDAETTQVSFTTDQLERMTPDQVIVGDGSIEPRSGFGACDR
ncbi:hypothetical protein [Nocardioides sp. L-11A]|uniref:hypothetical protein n=1 Tax=Nocardioides sp. L-11A TaxID=3043848 RepID=UPI00249AC75F|nr:hypothetical protein QJ852_13240 [Nocardioides sp. L-11A]